MWKTICELFFLLFIYRHLGWIVIHARRTDSLLFRTHTFMHHSMFYDGSLFSIHIIRLLSHFGFILCKYFCKKVTLVQGGWILYAPIFFMHFEFNCIIFFPFDRIVKIGTSLLLLRLLCPFVLRLLYSLKRIFPSQILHHKIQCLSMKFPALAI